VDLGMVRNGEKIKSIRKRRLKKGKLQKSYSDYRVKRNRRKSTDIFGKKNLGGALTKSVEIGRIR